MNGLHVALFRRSQRKGRAPPNTGGVETYADAAQSRVLYLATLRGRQLSSGAGRSSRREEEEEKPTGSLGQGGGEGGSQDAGGTGTGI